MMMDNVGKLVLTGHAVAFCSRECCSIHVDDTTWRKGVLVLDSEIEMPVIVAGKQSQAVKLGSSAVQVGIESWVYGLVHSDSTLRKRGNQDSGNESGLTEHLAIEVVRSEGTGRYGATWCYLGVLMTRYSEG